MTIDVRYMRIEENAMDHPKFIALSANAWRLWCEGGTYCQKHLTDGFIPKSALKGFRYYSPGALKMLLASLVPGKGPLWHEIDGGFQVHDYLQWNEPRGKVLEERQKAKDRYEKWKARKNAVGNGVGSAEKTGLNRTEQNNGATHRGGRKVDDPRRRHPLDESPRPLEPWSVEAFDRFIGGYPRPENKRAANEAWLYLQPSQELAETIIADVARRVRLGWAVEPRFVPLPARYLSERMWEDEFVPRVSSRPAVEPVARVVADADETSAYLEKLRSAR